MRSVASWTRIVGKSKSDPVLIPVTFLGSLAWSFVFVALPFQVERLSTSGPAGTLAWTGWILGVPSLAAVVTGPIWARYGERTDPKAACVLVQTLQGLGFLATALAHSVIELFIARLVLGAVGSFSTLAFVIAGRDADPTAMRRRLGAIQSALVLGTLVGPLPGAIAAARLGFRLTYLIGALVLVISASLLQWGMPSSPTTPREAAAGRRMPTRDIALAAALILVASSQETFLVAVLPNVLPGLGVGMDDLVEAGGLLIFVAGAAAALGGLAAPVLAEQISERRLLVGLLVGSSAALVLLGTARSFWAFAALRGVQCLAVAPFFPLMVAQVARRADASAIGIINAARVGSGFLGPLVATTVLATGSPGLLYVTLGAAGIATAVLLRRG
jgi:DHA1 family multidrug resistance protein-like MFS transporter